MDAICVARFVLAFWVYFFVVVLLSVFLFFFFLVVLENAFCGRTCFLVKTYFVMSNSLVS